MLWEYFTIYLGTEILLQGNVIFVKKKDPSVIYQNAIYAIKPFAINAAKKSTVKLFAKNARKKSDMSERWTMKIKTIFKLIKLIKLLKKIIPDDAISKGLEKLKGTDVSIKIPVLSSDDDVKNFIEEYGLDNVENMIKFFIELYFENFEVLWKSLDELKKLDLINTVSKVKGAKTTYEMSRGIADDQRRRQSISSAQTTLNEAISQLEDKIMFYIKKQRAIDDMSKFKRALRGKNLLNEIDNNNDMTKQAIDVLVAAVYLHTIIAEDMGDDIYLSILKPYEEFKNKLLANETCMLMNAYDRNYTDGFWSNLQDILLSVDMASTLTIEISNSYEEKNGGV